MQAHELLGSVHQERVRYAYVCSVGWETELNSCSMSDVRIWHLFPYSKPRHLGLSCDMLIVNPIHLDRHAMPERPVFPLPIIVFVAVAEHMHLGTLRCCQSRRAVHQLRRFLHRVQDSSSKEEENSRQIKRLWQVAKPFFLIVTKPTDENWLQQWSSWIRSGAFSTGESQTNPNSSKPRCITQQGSRVRHS